MARIREWRTSSIARAHRHAAAIAFAAVAASCGGPAAEVEDLASTSQRLEPGCRSVELVATRRFDPTRWEDASEALETPIAFAIPAEIPVVAGHTQRHRATLAIRTADALVTCRYVGGPRENAARGGKARAESDRDEPSRRRGKTPDDDASFRRFALESCSNGARAGASVTARWVGLRVEGGHAPAGPTTARVKLEELAPCVFDACSGVTAADLDDANPCTEDSCDPATGVVHAPAAAGTGCDDGDRCNGEEACDGAGRCAPGAAPEVDDGNACTADACDPANGVSHTATEAGTPCGDADACNGEETCDGAGACVAGSAPALDDGNPCTADACDADAGVTHEALAAGMSCSDGDACNGLETCDGAGSCVGGSAPAIDDGNPCTADACDPATGVTHAPVAAGASCGDGNACNGAETCDGAGACAAGSAPRIDDGNPCTADACDPATGATHAPVAAGASCGDGNACNGAETCNGSGACVAGAAPVVDDRNPCTADACDPVLGVTHTAVAAGTSCGDGNACNGVETCNEAGSCVAGAAPVVDDGNPCTADSCDPATGVKHTLVPAGTICGGTNKCTGVSTCSATGACVQGAPPPVDDGNPCTADSCDPALGVVHTPVPMGVSCEDGNACNGFQACDGAGFCATMAPPPPMCFPGF